MVRDRRDGTYPDPPMERFRLQIPFNRPYATGREFENIAAAISGLQLSGNGPFGRRCTEWLAERFEVQAVFLTPSCTAALELAALAAGIATGDEVIMPSYTFASTATSVVLRGATPVFVDIDPETLTIDASLAEAAITERTRAIVAVTYAGVAPDLAELETIACRNNVLLIEDAAQGFDAKFRDRPVGSIGSLGALSFHETKNVTCGEGGALLLRGDEFVARVEMMQEKGTDRARLFRGETDKYTWREIGSSFLLSEVNAAFLWAQLQSSEQIQSARHTVWDAYHRGFAELEADALVRRPIVPADRSHNAHLYYLLLPDEQSRDELIAYLRERGIVALFHYVPLHSSPAGLRFGRREGSLPVTDAISGRLVRLPLWVGMDDAIVQAVVAATNEGIRHIAPVEARV
jgi:dTDP-4-amino-4,6-dideoxygalactose transaminase